MKVKIGISYLWVLETIGITLVVNSFKWIFTIQICNIYLLKGK